MGAWHSPTLDLSLASPKQITYNVVVKPKAWLIPLLIVCAYLVTHLYKLTLLPVFADEAIYIRWAQLMIDDWQQYMFFPLNDGKTPLLMWLMVPFLLLGKDPLFMTRLLSVIVGIGQMFAVAVIIKDLGGKKNTSYLGMLLTAVLPFWYFHHRMALIDAVLSLFLTLTVWGLINLNQSNKTVKWTIATGVFFGLALLTKLPAILLLPIFPLYLALNKKITMSTILRRGMLLAGSAGIGVGIFALLKIHPAFGQLFSRGGDFLHPWRDILLGGGWMKTIKNLPTYFKYAATYLTLPVLTLMIYGLFTPDAKRRKVQHVLFWSALFFAGPMALLGKVVYPRYFLAVSIFATVMAALAIESLVVRHIHGGKVLWKQVLVGVVVALGISNIVTSSSSFIANALTNPAYIPFVSVDREQYLYEWSSGHGIVETVEKIQTEAQTKKIAIATEGSFGTLPDAILMYLHNQDVENIYVEGIGYPVKNIPSFFSERAKSFDTVWLVVNSHRIELDLQPSALRGEYCRPNNAPCLQVWDITDLVKNPPN
jgi:4-amino-4-deoxy-L-arabinose transferase-like glycosyltransferase